MLLDKGSGPKRDAQGMKVVVDLWWTCGCTGQLHSVRFQVVFFDKEVIKVPTFVREFAIPSA